MNEASTFKVARKRTLILMQEWLRKWRMPPVQPLHCPQCRSEKVLKRFRSVDRKTLRCAECRYEFSLEELPGCRCTYPGRLLTCLDCKHYQSMMSHVERNQEKLRDLSEKELNVIINAPGFWSRNMEPQTSGLRDEQAQHDEVKVSYAWNTPTSSSGYQLSLFDEIFSEVKGLNCEPEHESQNLEQDD